MKSSKIKTVVHTGSNNWKDKVLEKYLIVFENEENGTLTTGFQGVEPAPAIGTELEYTIEVTNFGSEIKLPRKSGSGGGFGGAKKWSTSQIAQQDAVKLTGAYIANGNDLKFWKAFFIEAKEFMIAQIDSEAKEDPALNKVVSVDKIEDITEPNGTFKAVQDDLPF